MDPVRNYALEDYLTDAFSEIFKVSVQNQPLNTYDINIQSAAIAQYIKNCGLKEPSVKSSVQSSDDAFADLEPAIPCNHMECNSQNGENSFLRINFGLPTLQPVLLNSLMTNQLQKALHLYKQARAIVTDSGSRSYYDFQIMTIGKIFKQ